ncbi:MAG: hypothetical protein WCT39_03830 [Candidatus Margulisiibacteriota bacterium]
MAMPPLHLRPTNIAEKDFLSAIEQFIDGKLSDCVSGASEVEVRVNLITELKCDELSFQKIRVEIVERELRTMYIAVGWKSVDFSREKSMVWKIKFGI